MEKKISQQKNAADNTKKDPHNIEISSTGYGYVPLDTKTENKDDNELEE